MIHERQCASVVMLCEVMEDGRVSYSVCTLAVVMTALESFAGSVCSILAGQWCIYLW